MTTKLKDLYELGDYTAIRNEDGTYRISGLAGMSFVVSDRPSFEEVLQVASRFYAAGQRHRSQ